MSWAPFPEDAVAELHQPVEIAGQRDEMVARQLPHLRGEGDPAIGQQDLGLADPAGIEDDLPRGREARVVLVAHAEIRVAERNPHALARPADMHDLPENGITLRKAAQVSGAFSSSSRRRR
jgi:hypothetical protein